VRLRRDDDHCLRPISLGLRTGAFWAVATGPNCSCPQGQTFCARSEPVSPGIPRASVVILPCPVSAVPTWHQRWGILPLSRASALATDARDTLGILPNIHTGTTLADD